MNETDINIQFHDEKLDALRYFLGKKEVTVGDELKDYLEKTYDKVVPQQVRDYVENREQHESAQQESGNSLASDQQERQPRQYHRRQREQAVPENSAVPEPQLEEGGPAEDENQGMGMSM